MNKIELIHILNNCGTHHDIFEFSKMFGSLHSRLVDLNKELCLENNFNNFHEFQIDFNSLKNFFKFCIMNNINLSDDKRPSIGYTSAGFLVSTWYFNNENYMSISFFTKHYNKTLKINNTFETSRFFYSSDKYCIEFPECMKEYLL